MASLTTGHHIKLYTVSITEVFDDIRSLSDHIVGGFDRKIDRNLPRILMSPVRSDHHIPCFVPSVPDYHSTVRRDCLVLVDYWGIALLLLHHLPTFSPFAHS